MNKNIHPNKFHSYNRIAYKETRLIIRTIYISFLCVIVGIVSGLGAVGFRLLINFFHNLIFLGELSFKHNAALSPWGNLVIFAPIIGIALSKYITRKWAPDAKGHGVAQVMLAVSENKGIIKPVLAIAKTLASALTIGSGGSVGKAGPIVLIGSSFGSTLGKFLKLSSRETIILVGAGAAGGISAAFNVPIGGVMFALELIIPEYSIMTLMPIVISSIVATHISTMILGIHPAFVISQYALGSSYELLLYAFIGLAAGFFSIAFIHTVYFVEDFFDNLKIPSIMKVIIGGTIVGSIGLLSLKLFGSYYLFGFSDEFVEAILSNKISSFGILLLLVILKIIASSVTFGSGGSGGIFAPSLFLGAALGGGLSILANLIFPGSVESIAAYAIVGMAAMVSGVTGGVLTSIFMIFEMTRNYEIMLPLMLGAVISHFVVKLFYKETMYTKKLARFGYKIQFDKRISTFKEISIRDIMHKAIVSCDSKTSIEETINIMHKVELGILPVIDNQEVLGTISYKELYNSKLNNIDNITSLINRKDICIPSNSSLHEALQLIHSSKSDILIVKDEDEILGIVTLKRLIFSSFTKDKNY